MKAFIVKRYGKKEKLQLAETAEPNVREIAILRLLIPPDRISFTL